MATRFDQMVDAPQKARMAEVDQGITPDTTPVERGNFRPDSREAAMERLQARRKAEGRPDAAELFERSKQQNIERAEETSRMLEGDLAPEEPDEDPVDEVEDDDTEVEASEAEDVDYEDAPLEDDADPGEEEEEATPRDAPRGWRESSEASDFFATLDPVIQDEISRRADAAESEYDRRFGELRRTEETMTEQAQSTKMAHDAAIRYLQTILQEDIPQEPPIDMLDPNSQRYDPEGHARLTHQHKLLTHRYNQRVQALQQMRQAAVQQSEEARGKAMAESEKLLFRKYPEWAKNNGEVGQQELAKLRRHLVEERDINPQVAEGLFDANLIMIAHDAMKWREHETAQRRARKTVPKKVKRMQRAQGRKSGAARADDAQLQALHARFKETGDIKDGQAYRRAKKASQTRG